MPADSSSGSAAATVHRFLGALVEHDWPAVSGCVSAEVRRTGPFGDVYQGRDAYVAFLAEVMPSLDGYRMDIDRVFATADGTIAVAELSETVVMDGRSIVTPQSLVFDVDESRLIASVSIYMRTKPG